VQIAVLPLKQYLLCVCRGSTISGNKATDAAGVGAQGNATAVMVGCTLKANAVTGDGASVWLYGAAQVRLPNMRYATAGVRCSRQLAEAHRRLIAFCGRHHTRT
jgi:hypothetical protein